MWAGINFDYILLLIMPAISQQPTVCTIVDITNIYCSRSKFITNRYFVNISVVMHCNLLSYISYNSKLRLLYQAIQQIEGKVFYFTETSSSSTRASAAAFVDGMRPH